MLLINQLVERQTKFLHQVKEPLVLLWASTGYICRPSSHVVTRCRAFHSLIECRATETTVHSDWLAVCLPQWIENIIH